jgi:hypothetical protein
MSMAKDQLREVKRHQTMCVFVFARITGASKSRVASQPMAKFKFTYRKYVRYNYKVDLLRCTRAEIHLNVISDSLLTVAFYK